MFYAGLAVRYGMVQNYGMVWYFLASEYGMKLRYDIFVQVRYGMKLRYFYRTLSVPFSTFRNHKDEERTEAKSCRQMSILLSPPRLSVNPEILFIF